MTDFMRKLAEQCANPIELLGFVGQLAFFARFVVQWIASERSKASVIPEAFWWISIAGGVVTLWYAFVHDPPLPPIILAQLFAIVFYARNVVLVRRMKRRAAEVASPA